MPLAVRGPSFLLLWLVAAVMLSACAAVTVLALGTGR
jgi:hypothetical protein